VFVDVVGMPVCGADGVVVCPKRAPVVDRGTIKWVLEGITGCGIWASCDYARGRFRLIGKLDNSVVL